ncbi:hypothetical protein FHS01_002061 [Longimicrobium terrae]|uniref:Uncharacterized protein n=1 Tax=Longimicrobium terrae TaxID=1639882 RepID=A0A841GSX9_9BACT|nr:hypothetical protein [Longimicrobium terrae]MBB6070440.1 hypothetical protein [Longimicrobium terrae]
MCAFEHVNGRLESSRHCDVRHASTCGAPHPRADQAVPAYPLRKQSVPVSGISISRRSLYAIAYFSRAPLDRVTHCARSRCLAAAAKPGPAGLHRDPPAGPLRARADPFPARAADLDSGSAGTCGQKTSGRSVSAERVRSAPGPRPRTSRRPASAGQRAPRGKGVECGRRNGEACLDGTDRRGYPHPVPNKMSLRVISAAPPRLRGDAGRRSATQCGPPVETAARDENSGMGRRCRRETLTCGFRR